MLTAREIAKMVESAELGWAGELRGDGLLLRLGAPLQPLESPVAAPTVDLANQQSIDRLYRPPWQEWGSFVLPAGEMALCQAAQPLRLGAGVAGAIGTLSHLARVGLAAHVASPWVMPGWDGHLTLELLNHGPAPLRIHHGMPAARLVLFHMDGPTSAVSPHLYYGRVSNGHLGSRYAEEFPA